MNNFLKVVLVLSIAVSPIVNATAQSTWSTVSQILSSKCGGGGCHQSSSIPSFWVDTTDAFLHNQLLTKTPLNPYAADTVRDYALVVPGHPERSFLLRKVAHSLDTYLRTDLVLETAEGGNMPPVSSGRPELTKVEVELIRQWIIAGADENTNYPTADTNVLSDYYNGNGIPMIQQPDPPAEGEGFQVHFGPVFFAAGEETEYTLQHHLKNDITLEVTGLDAYMSDESHHYILRKFEANDAGDEGLVEVGLFGVADVFGRPYVMTWQNDETFTLPNGTAYFWTQDTRLDLNFHMLNPNANDVLVGEVFMNVYTQPIGTADKEMKSGLEVNLQGISVPPLNNDGIPTTRTATTNYSDISIWTLTSHTHQWGKAFNMYLAGQNGTPDSLIYDGNVDYTTGINQGFYEYEHPPTRFWEPFLESMYDTLPDGSRKYRGIKQEATYVVPTTENPKTFGLTTNDEMMLFYIQYIDGRYKIPEDTTGTGIFTGEAPANNNINIYPNPSQGNVFVSFEIATQSTVSVAIYDILGRQALVLDNNARIEKGAYQYKVDASDLNDTGVYFVRFTIDGKSVTKKLIITE